MSNLESNELILEADNKRLASLCGPFDDNIKHLERRLGVEITYRNNHFKIIGETSASDVAIDLLKNLFVETVYTPE